MDAERALISKVAQTGKGPELLERVTRDYIAGEDVADVLEFVRAHVERHGRQPNVPTIIEHFPDFNFELSEEPLEYIYDRFVQTVERRLAAATARDLARKANEPNVDLQEWQDERRAMHSEIVARLRPSDNGASAMLHVTTVKAFTAEPLPGAAALVGNGDEIVIPENGDVMLYGDGGAGKTTAAVDLSVCGALGPSRPWLGIPIPGPFRTLLIENEGPQALFQQKLARKMECLGHPWIDEVIDILGRPWTLFSFADARMRAELAAVIEERAISLVIVGPITAVGMDTHGTIQEVRSFARYTNDVRARSGRNVTFCLIHHENKGGAVSGAWGRRRHADPHDEARGRRELGVVPEGPLVERVPRQAARWLKFPCPQERG